MSPPPPLRKLKTPPLSRQGPSTTPRMRMARDSSCNVYYSGNAAFCQFLFFTGARPPAGRPGGRRLGSIRLSVGTGWDGFPFGSTISLRFPFLTPPFSFAGGCGAANSFVPGCLLGLQAQKPSPRKRRGLRQTSGPQMLRGSDCSFDNAGNSPFCQIFLAGSLGGDRRGRRTNPPRVRDAGRIMTALGFSPIELLFRGGGQAEPWTTDCLAGVCPPDFRVQGVEFEVRLCHPFLKPLSFHARHWYAFSRIPRHRFMAA